MFENSELHTEVARQVGVVLGGCAEYLTHPAPNQALEPTPYSVRSSVAPASRRGSPPAFGCRGRHLVRKPGIQ
jgi:hypothetical protein